MIKINRILIPGLFFIHYLGIGAVAQVIVLILLLIELFRGKRLSITLADTIFLYCIALLFVLKLFHVGFGTNLLMLKFYWGFIVFYYYFKLSNYKFDLLLFFWLTVIITLLDFALINTIVPLEMMKNIPSTHAGIISLESKFLFINRSYGLASMPTASATILVALLAGLYIQQRDDFRNYHILITILPLICLGSGTGFLLFLFFVFVRFKLFKGLKFNIGVLFFLLFSYFVTKQSINTDSVFRRLSVDYFDRLIQLKSEQITDVLILLDHSLFETLFGLNYTSSMNVRIMSDFGWIDLLECYGIFGVFSFILFLVLKRKLAYLPILIFVIGYFHYPALGTIPGQILFASLLIFKFNNRNELELPTLETNHN
tara:strand:+ start:21456 stop:22568 length:1113 start_codon:yes stop_codon:yes gene_type:complete